MVSSKISHWAWLPPMRWISAVDGLDVGERGRVVAGGEGGGASDEGQRHRARDGMPLGRESRQAVGRASRALLRRRTRRRPMPRGSRRRRSRAGRPGRPGRRAAARTAGPRGTRRGRTATRAPCRPSPPGGDCGRPRCRARRSRARGRTGRGAARTWRGATRGGSERAPGGHSRPATARGMPRRRHCPTASKQMWAMLWLALALPGYCSSERSDRRRDSSKRPVS